jgi:ATP-dependent DNA helicase RecG
MTNAKILADGVPTIGGLLCYGKEPQKSNPNFRISAIRQEGVESSEEFIDRLEIGGPIENQINGALAFLRRHIPAASGIYATPFEAFDEAVINAAAHRDYMLNAQIRVFIYDDRLEVISPGRLLNTVTAETMRLGFHIVRNPVIFSFLSMCGLVTAAGRGIPNMLRALRAANFPAPEFVVVGAEFRVAFPLKP